MKVTLDLLLPKQKAVIHQNEINQIPLKLLEFGFLDGEIIEMLGKAPLGDPFLVLVNQTKVAIGKSVASQLVVEIIS